MGVNIEGWLRKLILVLRLYRTLSWGFGLDLNGPWSYAPGPYGPEPFIILKNILKLNMLHEHMWLKISKWGGYDKNHFELD